MRRISLRPNQVLTSGQSELHIDDEMFNKYYRYPQRTARKPGPFVLHRDLVYQALESSQVDIEQLMIRLRYFQAVGADYFLGDGNHRMMAVAVRNQTVPVELIENNSDYRRCRFRDT